jgi:hypothetical protein
LDQPPREPLGRPRPYASQARTGGRWILLLSVFRGFDQALFKTIDQGPGRVTGVVYPGLPAEASGPSSLYRWSSDLLP